MLYDDDVHYAITREHMASPTGYQPPAEVEAAEKAARDLIGRTKDRPRTRDEKRLLARYGQVRKAHHDALVAKWGPRPVPPEAAVDDIEDRIAAAASIDAGKAES